MKKEHSMFWPSKSLLQYTYRIEDDFMGESSCSLKGKRCFKSEFILGCAGIGNWNRSEEAVLLS